MRNNKNEIKQKIKPFLNYFIFTLLIFTFILALILISFSVVELIGKSFFADLIGTKIIDTSYYICIVLLTLGIGLIAYTQFSAIAKTGKDDLVLRISGMYLKSTIVEARTIIHMIWMDTENLPLAIQVDKTASKLNELKKNNHTDFVKVLTFLELLEDIAFQFNNHGIKESETDNFIGGSFIYYFCVMSTIIKKRREKYADSNYFTCIQKSTKQLIKKREGTPLSKIAKKILIDLE